MVSPLYKQDRQTNDQTIVPLHIPEIFVGGGGGQSHKKEEDTNFNIQP